MEGLPRQNGEEDDENSSEIAAVEIKARVTHQSAAAVDIQAGLSILERNSGVWSNGDRKYFCIDASDEAFPYFVEK